MPPYIKQFGVIEEYSPGVLSFRYFNIGGVTIDQTRTILVLCIERLQKELEAYDKMEK